MTRYELLDRIGVGGMAEIFRAKAVAAGGFEKPVAIKRILPHLSQDRRFVSLLIAEAKVLSQLRHRNIVQIFDVGLGDDGQYFLVMEFVDGTDLGAVQKTLEPRRRRLPLDLVLHIGAEVCEALEHAYKTKGPDGQPMRLVHRDVSPSNVLLSRSGEVKLTDFGIAKRAEEHTGHGAVRGKFAYISPEQARNEPVDARSDVFSVGVLLYEFCLGKRLFSGVPDLEALRAVREARVPKPSEVDATLPAQVEQLLLAALSRDPDQRPASAGQLGAQLRSIRYSLDEPAGDPATELGKIVENVGQYSEEPAAPKAARPKNPFESIEPTALRIRTADEFQDSDKEGTAVLRARELLAQFEEEETRMSQLGKGDLARLRQIRETGELTQAATPQAIFGSETSDDEATRFSTQQRLGEDSSTVDLEESTKFARPGSAPRGQPAPRGKQRAAKPATRPPPVPERRRDSTPAPVDPANEPTTLGGPAWSPPNEPPAMVARPAGTRPPPPGAPGLPGLSAPPPSGALGAPMPGAAAGPVPGGAFGGFGPPSPNPAYGPGPGPSFGAPPALANPPPGSAFDAHGRPVISPPGGPIIATVRPDRTDTPTARDRHDPSRVGPRSSLPLVEGFARVDESRRTMLLVIGAIITGILGFAITRAIIGGDDKKGATPAATPDARAADAAPTGMQGSGSGSAMAGSGSALASGSAVGSGSGKASGSGPGSGSAMAGSGSALASGSGTGSGSALAGGSGSGSGVPLIVMKPGVVVGPGSGSGAGSGSAAGTGSGSATKVGTTKSGSTKTGTTKSGSTKSGSTKSGKSGKSGKTGTGKTGTTGKKKPR